LRSRDLEGVHHVASANVQAIHPFRPEAGTVEARVDFFDPQWTFLTVLFSEHRDQVCQRDGDVAASLLELILG
jgi:hypothetical protein